MTVNEEAVTPLMRRIVARNALACVYLLDGQKTNKSADIRMKCDPFGGLGSTVQQ